MKILKLLIIFIFGTLLFVFIVNISIFALINNTSFSTYSYDIKNPKPIGPITSNMIVADQFIPTQNYLSSIYIDFGTYLPINNAALKIYINDKLSTKNPIYEYDTNTLYIQDKAFAKIDINTINKSKEKLLYLIISAPDNTLTNNITVYAGDKINGNSLFINGKSVNQSLNLELGYQNPLTSSYNTLKLLKAQLDHLKPNFFQGHFFYFIIALFFIGLYILILSMTYILFKEDNMKNILIKIAIFSLILIILYMYISQPYVFLGNLPS